MDHTVEPEQIEAVDGTEVRRDRSRVTSRMMLAARLPAVVESLSCEARYPMPYEAPRAPEPPRDHALYLARAEARRARRNAKRAALLKQPT